MNLSPAVRHALTIVATLVAAVGALLAGGTVGDVPEWVGVTVTVLGTLFAALGIVPGAVGGTQQGVVNPSVTEPPAAKIDEAGYAEGGLIVAIFVLFVIVICLKALTGSWLVFLLLLLIVLAFLF